MNTDYRAKIIETSYNFWEDESDEILLHIFSLLPPDPKVLSELSLTCKRWHKLLFDPLLLQALFFKVYPHPIDVYKEGLLNKEFFFKELLFNQRMHTRFFAPKKWTLPHKKDKFFGCSSGKIVTLEEDGQINIKNFKGEVCKSFRIDPYNKWDFKKVINNYIICSNRQFISVFNFEGNEIKKFKALFSYHIQEVILIGDRLVLSFYNKIQIWNWKEGHLEKAYSCGHPHNLQTTNEVILFKTDAGIIKLNLENGNSCNLNIDSSRVSALLVEKDKLIIGYLSGEIALYDLEGHLTKIFEIRHEIHIKKLALVHGKLISVSKNQIKIWDLDKGTPLKEFEHETLNYPHFYEEKMISLFEDYNKVEVCDFLNSNTNK